MIIAQVKWRKQLAMFIPFCLVHLVWWTAMIRWNSFHKFTDKVGQMDKYKAGPLDKSLHSEVRPWYARLRGNTARR